MHSLENNVHFYLPKQASRQYRCPVLLNFRRPTEKDISIIIYLFIWSTLEYGKDMTVLKNCVSTHKNTIPLLNGPFDNLSHSIIDNNLWIGHSHAILRERFTKCVCHILIINISYRAVGEASAPDASSATYSAPCEAKATTRRVVTTCLKGRIRIRYNEQILDIALKERNGVNSVSNYFPCVGIRLLKYLLIFI